MVTLFKPLSTRVPKVINKSLRIYYKRRNIELAGDLLPEAINAVKDTYDRYRNSKFSDFYDRTKELYLD